MLTFENVYKNVPEKVSAAAKDLWRTEAAIVDENEMETRATELVFIVRHADTGKLVGVSSAVKKKVKALNENFFYEFRCFISQAHRVAGLDVKLSKMTFDFLESIGEPDADKAVGIFAILENETLKKEDVWRRAVWPEIEMYFVGYTNTGHPIRVHYFKGAKI